MILQFRRQLLGSTLLVSGLIYTAPALAQQATPPQADTPAEAVDSSEAEIVVTGTLITNANLTASSPVAIIAQDEIQLRQSNVAEEILRDLPGAVPSIGSAVNNGTGGSAFVDLRGLGVNRNVVLLDGVRVVPANLLGVFDLNNVPLALVERIDVLTGGASTTYGADAISGVVNFITKRDFAGVEASASEQITERGDGNFFRADVTIGGNFDDGRGNAVFSIGYQQSDPVYQGDRDFSVFQLDSFSNTNQGSGTTVPARFTLGGGRRQINPATGALVPTFATFNFNPYNVFQTPFERFNMYGSAHYEVADGLEAYAQGLFSKNSVTQIAAPSGLFDSAVTIPLSNPYLPVAARNQFCAQDNSPAPGIQPLYTPAECSAAALATSPGDPNYRTVTTSLQRRTTEAGPRVDTFRTTIFNYRAGLRGDISDRLKFDVFGAYGESENVRGRENYVLLSRTRQALLATNRASCLDPTGGCVPLNIFGPDGSITADQLAFLKADVSAATDVSLAQARGVVNGDFGISSPFAETPISFAVGTEYRKYKARVRPDVSIGTPDEVGGSGSATRPVDGGYDVYEGFAELIAPLVKDKPFFDELTLEAGLRRSRYSVDAPGAPTFKTTTYKFGGSWKPMEGLKFRANYQRAVRAPNIFELFSPLNTGLTNLSVDPCAGAAPTTNANLQAVCLAQGAPPISIGSITNPSAGQANLTTGGNPNIQPEKANTYTIGAVIQPAFIPALSLTVDYYNIKLSDAITVATPGDLIGACFGATPTNPPPGAATNPACTIIRRNPNTGGLDGSAATTPGLLAPLTNRGRISTDGIDLTMNYRHEFGFGRLSLSFNGNYTRSVRFRASPTSIDRQCVGFYSVNCGLSGSIQPKFTWNQRTTFSVGDVDLSLLWRHINHVRFEPQQFADDLAAAQGAPADCPNPMGADPGGCVVDPKFRQISARNYFDLSARINASDNLEMTLTVQNLFDKQPPILGNTIGSTAFNSGNTYPSTYDALGRRFAVGARLKF